MRQASAERRESDRGHSERRRWRWGPVGGALATCAALAALATAGAAQGVAQGGEALGAGEQATVFAPGVLSDAREQWRITFTPDGRTAYFAASAEFFPRSRQATIYVAHRRGDGWSAPEVAPFSGRYSDIDPCLSPSGDRLYFASIRPVDGAVRGDVDLWVVERAGGGWGEPVRLGPAVNTPADELYPSVAADGTLYFASGPAAPRPGEHFDIYQAARRGGDFAPRVRMGGAINTVPARGGGPQDAWEFNPEISADGKTLVFTSLRPGGHGLGDLYVSHRRSGGWTPARNLGPVVNTAADEYHPTVSRDRRELYFVRRSRATGAGDFYRVATRALAGF
jgi:Tol biopolymer transport system component